MSSPGLSGRPSSQGEGGEKSSCVYILASRIGGTLYIGVTSDLIRRVYEHRSKVVPGFTKKNNVSKLVYYENSRHLVCDSTREAAQKWPRVRKIR